MDIMIVDPCIRLQAITNSTSGECFEVLGSVVIRKFCFWLDYVDGKKPGYKV